MAEPATKKVRSAAGAPGGVGLEGIDLSKKPAKPALRMGGESRKEFRWDEEAVAATEAGKDSTMKITEPDTPYNYDYESSGDEGGEGDGQKNTKAREEGEGTGSPPALPAAGKPAAGKGEMLNPMDVLGALAKVAQEQEEEAGEAEYKPKDLESAARDEFASKRKNHYNEFEAARRWAAEHDDDDEDDDEDDE